MRQLRFIIVGSGYRSLFYARIAQRYPGRFRLIAMLCRSEEKVQAMTAKGIPATTSEEECIQAAPDFVVVAVSKEAIAAVAASWAGRGFAVVTETPAGASREELKKLWELHVRGARLQVCEQYRRLPIIAAGLRELAAGTVGEPYHVRLSMAHDYHAASLIRAMLQIGIEPVTLIGAQYSEPVLATDSRSGPVTDGSMTLQKRDHIVMEFASGKTAVYDFAGVQYRSFIRTRHLLVQGPRGEWSDTMIYAAEECNSMNQTLRPERRQLMPYYAPEYAELMTQDLWDLSKSWKSEYAPLQIEEEYAIATLLSDLSRYLGGGEEAYPFREALEDAYTWLLMQEAVSRPWEKVRSEKMPWHE